MTSALRMLDATVSLTPAVPGETAKSTFRSFAPERLEAFRRMKQGGAAGRTPRESPPATARVIPSAARSRGSRASLSSRVQSRDRRSAGACVVRRPIIHV